jgi:hypothetical protein
MPLALSSCSSQTLNVDQLERRLGRQLSAALDVHEVVVRCPETIDVARGTRVRCTARVPGEAEVRRVTVTQVDDDGHVTWELVDADE